MIAKKHKLPIDLFPKTAKVLVRNNLFVIKTAPNSLSLNRAGVTFKSKAFKTAVLRNKLKRFFFDYLRSAGFFRISKSTHEDLLIILNPPIISLSKEELAKELKKYDKLFV